MQKIHHLLLAIVLVLSASFASAQESAANSVSSQVLLEGFSWVHQGVNRCSAAALTIQLSYYMPVTVDTYFELARSELNTFGADASVRLEEMAAVAEARGLRAIVRRGGTVDLLRQLLNAGFPVLIENVYYNGEDLYRDWMSHNRVLVGYDDTTQTLYFQDPLLGYPNGDLVTYTYEEIDSRWRPFNRDYMVFYRPEEEAALQAVLGNHWDEVYNAQWVLETSQAEIAASIPNPQYSYFNLGWAQLQLGMYSEAAASFDTARSIGLPMRMLWYEFGAFEAYLQVGRYDDVRYLVNQEINIAGDEISIEEWYFYAAQAYEGLGQLDRAILNYEVALTRNTNYSAAAERLQALRGN